VRGSVGAVLGGAHVIEPEDRLELAPGVVLDGGTVVDRVCGARIPANETAALVLAHANGATVAELGELLARAGAHDGVRDARAFCAHLNRLLLVNVHVGRGALLRRRLAGARFGMFLRPPLRRIDARSTLRVLCALVPVGAVFALLSLPLAILAGVWTIPLPVGGGIVLHELGHAVALYGVPRALVLDGLRPSVVHPQLGAVRTIAVAAAGPLAPSLAALGLAAVIPSAACAPLAAHALALTVLAPDGRNACGLS